MKKLGFYLPVVIFIGLLGYMAFGLTLDPSRLPSALINDPVPEFTLPPIEGFIEGLSSEDLKGEVSLLNIWGSWCEPCKDEHPLLMEIFENDLVPIYGINWKDLPGQGTKWLEVWENPFKKIGNDFEGRVIIDLGVSAAPETFVIDRQGIIRFRYEGAITEKVWREEIYPLILELRK